MQNNAKQKINNTTQTKQKNNNKKTKHIIKHHKILKQNVPKITTNFAK